MPGGGVRIFFNGVVCHRAWSLLSCQLWGGYGYCSFRLNRHRQGTAVLTLDALQTGPLKWFGVCPYPVGEPRNKIRTCDRGRSGEEKSFLRTESSFWSTAGTTRAAAVIGWLRVCTCGFCYHGGAAGTCWLQEQSYMNDTYCPVL